MSAPFPGHSEENRASRHVVAVSAEPHRAELLDSLMDDDVTRDIIVVESIERGYARIKQVAPDIIFVLVGPEDVAACQLLSMLNIDRETSSIPLVTWMTRRNPIRFGDIVEQIQQESSSGSAGIQLN